MAHNMLVTHTPQGIRTFQEQEVKKKELREDLLQKMVAVDPNEPTEDEKKANGITKLRLDRTRTCIA